MKSKNLLVVIFVAIFIAASSAFTSAQTKDFTDGPVWQVSFVKTKANMGVEYLNSLKSNWNKMHDEAIKQGLILSYKTLSGNASNPDDWDIMLMVQYKNMAAMEGSDDKWDVLMKTVLGGEEAMKATNQSRVNVREIYGVKVLREVIYK